MAQHPDPSAFRNALRAVMLLNLAYFGVEFAVALNIRSVSLFADSIDFLEDASLNFLILIALKWTPRSRATLGMLLAVILLVPGIATLWTAVEKLSAPGVSAPIPLSLTGTGALAVNLCCAFLLARHRHHQASLSRAAFLSARNDALANMAIIVAGVVTAYVRSVWPDLLVGLAIAAMNASAAYEVWRRASRERSEAHP